MRSNVNKLLKEPVLEQVSTSSTGATKETLEIDKLQHIIEMKPMPLPTKFAGTALFDSSKGLDSKLDMSSKDV